MALADNASVLTALYGTDEALVLDVTLRAGALSMTLRGGSIVHLKVAGYEVWHGVSFLYRDTDWATPEPVFERVVQEVNANDYSLQLEGYIPTQPAIDLLLKLHGNVQGAVTLQARAVPRGELLANRIGLCLLHPMHAMGRAFEVEHVDGRISCSSFPEHVPPWPLFTGIRAIRHEFAPGHWAHARFHGDDFELEDQRNNADASFKTYSRSNHMPRPYVLRGGAVIEQSLTLHLEPSVVPLDPVPAHPPAFRLNEGHVKTSMPHLGLGIAPADAQSSLSVKAALADMSPSLLHLTLSRPEQPVDWTGIAELLSGSGARLRLDVLAGVTAAALARIAAALNDANIQPESVAVFPSTPPVIMAARQVFPGTAIGGGTPHFFAQFNRMEDVGHADYLGFTVCPIVHSADDAAPMAGLEALPSMLATARARFPGRALRIGPSSLGARSSPLGKQPASDGTRRIALASRDPRTRGLFGAAWLVGHVVQAARAGAEAVSVFSLRGDAGVIDETVENQLLRHPTFFVLAQLGRLKPQQAVTVLITNQIAALAGVGNGPLEWLIANLTNQPVALTAGCGVPARVMDAIAWQAYASGAATSPWRMLSVDAAGGLQLDAFAIALL